MEETLVNVCCSHPCDDALVDDVRHVLGPPEGLWGSGQVVWVLLMDVVQPGHGLHHDLGDCVELEDTVREGAGSVALPPAEGAAEPVVSHPS